MSGDGDHARRQDECLQTGTSTPLKRAVGVQDTQSWTPLVFGPAANEVAATRWSDRRWVRSRKNQTGKNAS